MAIATSEPSALDQLAAARLRGAKPERLLELSEAAIDQATAAGDNPALESIAGELDAAAAAHPDQGDGLRLQFAAERAHAIASQPPVSRTQTGSSGRQGAFRVAGQLLGVVVILALSLFAAMLASGSYEIAYVLMFVVVLGPLLVALTGAIGFVRRFQRSASMEATGSTGSSSSALRSPKSGSA